jgi:hypothetical protein
MKIYLIRATVAFAAILGAAQIGHADDGDAPQCEDGVIEVSGSNGEYSFSGYCEKAVIAGGDNRVTLGDVGTLEIAGSNHDVTAGNVDMLNLAGGDNSVKIRSADSAEIAGNDHDLLARFIGNLDVAGGNNGVKSDQIGSVVVAGNDNLIEYRQLNLSETGAKKLVHPARNVQGSSNRVSWNKAAF